MTTIQVQSSHELKEYSNFEDMPIFDGPTGMKLLRGVLAYGFTTPSPIQQKTIVEVAQGYDVIAQAQSGTGKTGAFTIGSLAHVDVNDPHVQVIVVCHTHELAIQTTQVIKDLSQKMGIHVECCIGQQVAVVDNIHNIKKGAHVAVGTPGRLEDLLKRGVFRTERIKTVILDEADKLLQGRFLQQTRQILETIETDRLEFKTFMALAEENNVYTATKNLEKQLQQKDPDTLLTNEETLQTITQLERRLNTRLFKNLPSPGSLDETSSVQLSGDGKRLKEDLVGLRSLQVCIFSATFCPEVVELADCVMDNPTTILVPPEQLTLEGIDQYYIDCEESDPREAARQKLRYILAIHQSQTIPKGIIYVNKCSTAEKVCDQLNENGFQADCIHGNKRPIERTNIIKDFRKGKIRVLVSTDLLARGFDVQQVKIVINFSLPSVIVSNTAELDMDKIADYQHRIGRSGRFGRKGIAINMISTPYEHSCLKRIQEYYKIDIAALPEQLDDVFS